MKRTFEVSMHIMKYLLFAIMISVSFSSCKKGEQSKVSESTVEKKKKGQAQAIDSTPFMKEYAKKQKALDAKKAAAKSKRGSLKKEESGLAKGKEETSSSVNPKKKASASLTPVEVVNMPSSGIFLPEIPNMLSPAQVSKAFSLSADDVSLEGSVHNPGSRMSRGAWTWYDDTNQFRRFTVNLNTNPLPGELNTWEEQSMTNLFTKGLRFSDGSSIAFDEVKHKGRRYAWSEDAHILKWFYNGDYTFNIAGIGAQYGDKSSFLKIADILNSELEKGLRNN